MTTTTQANAIASPDAITTRYTTSDGLAVYDLAPQAGDLYAVAGPAGIDPRTIDQDSLPAGFRWVEPAEWEALQGQ